LDAVAASVNFSSWPVVTAVVMSASTLWWPPSRAVRYVFLRKVGRSYSPGYRL
jgi:hypothetical protein